MKTLSKWLIGLGIALLLGLGSGAMITYRLTHVSAPERSLNTQTILRALKPQGFLVTQSIISEQRVTIDKRSGNIFKDFFLGQTITARATMEANLGIDLMQLTENDITVTDNRITIRIPEIRLFNTRLIGDVEVENSQGIIKRIFQPDDGYNESLQALASSTEALADDERILRATRERSKEELRRLINLLQTEIGRASCRERV